MNPTCPHDADLQPVDYSGLVDAATEALLSEALGRTCDTADRRWAGGMIHENGAQRVREALQDAVRNKPECPIRYTAEALVRMADAAPEGDPRP